MTNAYGVFSVCWALFQALYCTLSHLTFSTILWHIFYNYLHFTDAKTGLEGWVIWMATRELETAGYQSRRSPQPRHGLTTLGTEYIMWEVRKQDLVWLGSWGWGSNQSVMTRRKHGRHEGSVNVWVLGGVRANREEHWWYEVLGEGTEGRRVGLSGQLVAVDKPKGDSRDLKGNPGWCPPVSVQLRGKGVRAVWWQCKIWNHCHGECKWELKRVSKSPLSSSKAGGKEPEVRSRWLQHHRCGKGPVEQEFCPYRESCRQVGVCSANEEGCFFICSVLEAETGKCWNNY